jgi:hypothetical protein
MTTNLPNFFVVGAPKAGTTSLCKYLGQHPQIFVSPIKEPCYFAPEVRDFSDATRRAALEGAMVFDWDDYRRLFDGVRGEAAIGEGSVSYLSSPAAASGIHARSPHARIIMVLRDPIDRLFSHYIAACAAGVTSAAFVEWAFAERDTEASRRPVWGPVWAGCYATHVRRFMAVFPSAQLRIHLYDDFVHAPHDVYRDLLEFLDVDPTVPLDASARHNVTRVPRFGALTHRWVRPVTHFVRGVLPVALAKTVAERLRTSTHPGPRAEERARLMPLVAGEVTELQTMIGRDLSAWLDVRTRAVA